MFIEIEPAKRSHPSGVLCSSRALQTRSIRHIAPRWGAHCTRRVLYKHPTPMELPHTKATGESANPWGRPIQQRQPAERVAALMRGTRKLAACATSKNSDAPLSRLDVAHAAGLRRFGLPKHHPEPSHILGSSRWSHTVCRHPLRGFRFIPRVSCHLI
jgi:hypothetical protein